MGLLWVREGAFGPAAGLLLLLGLLLGLEEGAGGVGLLLLLRLRVEEAGGVGVYIVLRAAEE